MIPEILLELCSRQKLLHKYDDQHHDSCAMHFYLMRSIHLCSFKMITEILFELCSGQKLSMKINKGQ